jgi:hypothetical protein
MEIFNSLGVWKYSQVFSLAAKTISMEIFPWLKKILHAVYAFLILGSQVQILDM